MSGQTPPRNESRLFELLADRALCGLTEAEQKELDAVRNDEPAPPGCPPEFCELDVAAGEVAAEICSGDSQGLPRSVSAKLQSVANQWCADHCGVVGRVGPGATANERRDGTTRVLAYLGWIAAAACLAFAVWATRAPTARGVSERLAAFEASANDIASAPWAPFNDLTTGAPPEQPSVSGHVKWSESKQTGFISFKGLKPNDPSAEQYQLWIIDRRGLGQRISGALFNAAPDPKTGEVIVPIDPRIAVDNASIFAVTIEPPGGVWVSDMSRRVVLAKLAG